LAGVRIGGKWGGVDKTGKIVVQPQFEASPPQSDVALEIVARDIRRVTLSDGLAAVRVGNKFGYIDMTGKYVIDPQFDEADPFVDGLAMIVIGHGSEAKLGWIDKTVKYVWNPTN
jgi:hypothetical protein